MFIIINYACELHKQWREKVIPGEVIISSENATLYAYHKGDLMVLQVALVSPLLVRLAIFLPQVMGFRNITDLIFLDSKGLKRIERAARSILEDSLALEANLLQIAVVLDINDVLMTTIDYFEEVTKRLTSLVSVDNSSKAGLDSVLAGMCPLPSYCKKGNSISGMRKALLAMVLAVLNFVLL